MALSALAEGDSSLRTISDTQPAAQVISIPMPAPGAACASLYELYNNFPVAVDYIKTIRLTKDNDVDQSYKINFYRLSTNSDTSIDNVDTLPNLDTLVSPEEFLKRRNFDTFAVYKLDKNGNPWNRAVASGYFKDTTMIVFYDILARDENGLPMSRPDGFVDGRDCFPTKDLNIKEEIFRMLNQIGSKREVIERNIRSRNQGPKISIT